MAIEELMRVVTTPAYPVERGSAKEWDELLQILRIPLPSDLCDFSTRYGTGFFDDPGRIMIFIYNPFSVHYIQRINSAYNSLQSLYGLPRKTDALYRIFSHQPNYLPLGNDIDGNFLCWLTQGESNVWPIILLSPQTFSFQQLNVSLTTLLAKVFTHQLPTIFWNKPEFFSGSPPLHFIPWEQKEEQTEGRDS